MKTKVLITGAKGQLAKTIKELFFNDTDNLEFVFVSKSDLDISNEKHVSSFLSINNFDYCVNCAAYTNVEQSELQPELAYKTNTNAVKTLAVACKKKQCCSHTYLYRLCV